MVLVDFRSFGGIPFYVVAFLRLIRFISLSISDKAALLNEKLEIFVNLLLISKTLGWFLFYLFIAFSTKLMSKVLLTILTGKGLVFHSIQYRNSWLAASDLFHMFTQATINGCSFRQVYGKIWVSFCLNTGKHFLIEVSFSSQQKEHRFF